MKNLLLGIFGLLFLVACSTPQKSFQNQDYRRAFKLSLKKVKNKKANRNEREILTESLRQILMENDGDISIFMKSETPDQWKKSFKIIDDSQKKISQASPYVRFDFSEKKKSLLDLEVKIKSDIYGFYLRKGKLDLDHSIATGNKFAAQSAYQDFQTAKKYTDQTRLIDSLQAVCVEYGHLIYTIDSDTPFGLSWEVDRAFNGFENESDRFLTVYYDRNVPEADCRIEIDFRDFDIRYGQDVTEDRQFEKEVESGYRTEKDTAGNEIRIPTYETVYGNVRVEELSKIAIAAIWINVYANTENCQLRDNRINDEVVNVIERTYISGDRRAIPSRYDDNFQDELMDDDDLAEELFDQLYQSIRGALF